MFYTNAAACAPPNAENPYVNILRLKAAKTFWAKKEKKIWIWPIWWQSLAVIMENFQPDWLYLFYACVGTM